MELRLSFKGHRQGQGSSHCSIFEGSDPVCVRAHTHTHLSMRASVRACLCASACMLACHSKCVCVCVRAHVRGWCLLISKDARDGSRDRQRATRDREDSQREGEMERRIDGDNETWTEIQREEEEIQRR